LLGHSNTLFHLWHQFSAGKLSRKQLQTTGRKRARIRESDTSLPGLSVIFAVFF